MYLCAFFQLKNFIYILINQKYKNQEWCEVLKDNVA